MPSRKGLWEENKWVVMEFMGALVVVVFLVIFASHFFSGFATECLENEECKAAKQELNRFVKDVNEACKNSANQNTPTDPEVLGEYDFGASNLMVVKNKNSFTLGKMDDLPAKEPVSAVMDVIEDGTWEWRISRTAQECNKAYRCGLLSGAKNCDSGFGGLAKDLSMQFWPFHIGGSDGTFRYSNPESRVINLKWKGGNVPDVPKEEIECGNDPKNTCSAESSCVTPSQNDEHNAQCGSGEVCCRSIGSP